MVMDEALRGEAAGVAQRLRRAGRTVDLVLEAKKMKWVFKVTFSAFQWSAMMFKRGLAFACLSWLWCLARLICLYGK